MGLFGDKKPKCTKCKGPITDSSTSEESIRSMGSLVAGLALRNCLRVICGKCGKIFCVRCIELNGNHKLGGLPCPSCQGQMGVDLPAALPLIGAYVRKMNPGLNVGQGDALTQLIHNPLGRATYNLRGFINDKSLLGFIDMIKAVDPDLAKYLADRSQINRDLIVVGLPD